MSSGPLERFFGRLRLERLFGIEELYLGRRSGPRAESPGKEPDRAPEPDRGGPDPERSREVVERAKRRLADLKEAEAGPRPLAAAGGKPGPGRPPGEKADKQQPEIVIEDLPGASAEMSLFSAAERSGLPNLSLGKGSRAERLGKLCEWAAGCERCPLSRTRKTVVFGEGDPEAGLVFVGEAPGAEEDKQGRPFVGRAGQLLTKIIEAMGMRRGQVYICNVLKCRPPGNRTPAAEEIGKCSPILFEQLAIIRPKVVCALGGPATKTLLATKEGITRLRGRFFRYGDVPLMPTFHPAYLLRKPWDKPKVWEDMKKLRAFLGRAEGGG